MTKLVFLDVDDTLLAPPYRAVRAVARLLRRPFPTEQEFLERKHLHFYDAFPDVFRSPREMWAFVILALPFDYFKSQKPLQFDIAAMAQCLADHRVYLISKNPPSFTRWRVQWLEQLFNTRVGDRYIACGPMFQKGHSKLQVMTSIAESRGVGLNDCLLIDDSLDNIRAAAAAGACTAVVTSTWNEADELPPSSPKAKSERIRTTHIPTAIRAHLNETLERDEENCFVLPPVGLRTGARAVGYFLRRSWLYNRGIPRSSEIAVVARNPMTSFLYTSPHDATYRKLQSLLHKRAHGGGIRLLGGSKKQFTTLIDISDEIRAADTQHWGQVQKFRSVCRVKLQQHGVKLVPKNMFFFDGYARKAEMRRLLKSERVQKAMQSFGSTHNVALEAVRHKATSYAAQITAQRTYFGCFFLQHSLDLLSSRIFKRRRVVVHPSIAEMEQDTFMVYAATHRSYLDGGLLFAAIAGHARSFPFIVAADKMRFVWIGRLGARAGAFFLQRKFVDIVYAAILEEHMAIMQREGASMQIFLEGQRSRSGLTLPPKKGIASMIWQNMPPGRSEQLKVALVPVSFAYNKLPEAELILLENFEERRKAGTATLREMADMKVKTSRIKTPMQRLRGGVRRILSTPVSHCYITFAEPIILQRPPLESAAADRQKLQAYLDQAMCQVNANTTPLASSFLCFAVLNAVDHHIDKALAEKFIALSSAILQLYKVESLSAGFEARAPEQHFADFLSLPFINRKFKRNRLDEEHIACLSDLDIQRATYYRNNVIHFLVLPALIGFVLVDSKSGHIDELHRFLDHMLTKVQKIYFVPPIESASIFIDGFVQYLAACGLLVIADKQYTLAAEHVDYPVIAALAKTGAQMMDNEFSADLAVFKRSYKRREVDAPVEIISFARQSKMPAQVLATSSRAFYVRCQVALCAGDAVSFSPKGDCKQVLQGLASNPDPDGSMVERTSATEQSTQTETAVAYSALDAAPHQPVTGDLVYRRTTQVTGVLANLSPTGAFIKVPGDFEKDDRVVCRIPTSGKPLVVEGVVMRVAETGIGLQFEKMNAAGHARLMLLYHDPT